MWQQKTIYIFFIYVQMKTSHLKAICRKGIENSNICKKDRAARLASWTSPLFYILASEILDNY